MFMFDESKRLSSSTETLNRRIDKILGASKHCGKWSDIEAVKFPEIL